MVIKKIFYYLGSVYFSILLIALTVFFVIAGTFIESWSQSHLFAARFTYNNPLFTTLLWLYFFNILFSTLRRFPFQGTHIPFIITHLGLLMILGGLLMKSHFGLQGAMELTEGGGSSLVRLPNSYALYIESRTGKVELPLKAGTVGPLTPPFEGLEITLIDWTPHSTERIEGWIKGDFGHILGLPPFPVTEGISLKTPEYNIYALKSDQMPKEDIFEKPALIFIQDSEFTEQLIVVNESGERFSQTFDGNLIWIFDKGYGGYGYCFELPPNFPPLELITVLTHVCEAATPHRKQEELMARIRLLVSDGTHSEIVALAHDRHGTHYKWPILNGSYLLRFQSEGRSIPYPVRLREARQINYPGSQQPYSFESDLIIDDTETTISMNHVYEKKGYRFYMANLINPPLGAKRMQLVINHDPAKYYLTYPGAAMLVLGTILLYFSPRRSKK